MKRSKYEGLQDKIRTMKMPRIEVWKNQYADKDYVVEINVPEFTCLCPKTDLPDFAAITVRYKPDRWCAELKSLKYYMLFYRDVGIFNEHVVNKILEDFVRCCKPRWAEVVGVFNPRGGMSTTIRCEYKKP